MKLRYIWEKSDLSALAPLGSVLLLLVVTITLAAALGAILQATTTYYEFLSIVLTIALFVVTFVQAWMLSLQLKVANTPFVDVKLETTMPIGKFTTDLQIVLTNKGTGIAKDLVWFLFVHGDKGEFRNAFSSLYRNLEISDLTDKIRALVPNDPAAIVQRLPIYGNYGDIRYTLVIKYGALISSVLSQRERYLKLDFLANGKSVGKNYPLSKDDYNNFITDFKMWSNELLSGT